MRICLRTRCAKRRRGIGCPAPLWLYIFMDSAPRWTRSSRSQVSMECPCSKTPPKRWVRHIKTGERGRSAIGGVLF